MKLTIPMVCRLAVSLLGACLVADGEPGRAADAAPLPRIVAHRGLLRHAPENTLANFRACLELRLGFEVDVQRCQDGPLVCVHDETLDRTTDGSGRVAERTLAELKKLDAGSWFDPAYSGERIPTLDEVFQMLARYAPGPLVAIDLKAAGVEQDVVRLATRHRVLDRLLFIGLTIRSPDVRSRLRQLAPGAHVAVVANDAQELPAALSDTVADWVYVRYVPTADEVARIHEAGRRVFIAGPTVAGEERENWLRAARHGVDGILTDYPLPLAGLLRQGNGR